MIGVASTAVVGVLIVSPFVPRVVEVNLPQQLLELTLSHTENSTQGLYLLGVLGSGYAAYAAFALDRFISLLGF